MAYCNQCGAYIPDGQTKCLACGFDETEAAAKTEYSGGYAYQTKQDPIQEEMERQREERREESRRWAEEEKRRRDEEKARQKAEEERRRAAESRQREYTPPKSKSGTDTSKLLACASYLGILFLLPFLAAPKDGYAKFHAKQGALLFVLGALMKGVGNIFGLGWAVTLARLYLIYKGMMNALEGRAEPLPWIGKLFDK